jgi:AcrR family transcriptional regulator
MAAPRKDNVKGKILDAAEALLQTKNLSDISLAEIAALAGVSKGTLYYHYKNKTDILFDITDRYLSKQWDELVSWTENREKDTSMHRLVKYVVERNVASANIRLHLLNAAMLGDEALRQKLTARYAEFEELISSKIAERSSTVPPTVGAGLCSARRSPRPPSLASLVKGRGTAAGGGGIHSRFTSG